MQEHRTVLVVGEASSGRDQLVHEVRMPSPIQTGDKTLYLGRWNQPGRNLAADIDDFAIWRRALQPAEIAMLSQGPPGD